MQWQGDTFLDPHSKLHHHLEPAHCTLVFRLVMSQTDLASGGVSQSGELQAGAVQGWLCSGRLAPPLTHPSSPTTIWAQHTGLQIGHVSTLTLQQDMLANQVSCR